MILVRTGARGPVVLLIRGGWAGPLVPRLVGPRDLNGAVLPDDRRMLCCLQAAPPAAAGRGALRAGDRAS